MSRKPIFFYSKWAYKRFIIYMNFLHLWNFFNKIFKNKYWMQKNKNLETKCVTTSPGLTYTLRQASRIVCVWFIKPVLLICRQLVAFAAHWRLQWRETSIAVEYTTGRGCGQWHKQSLRSNTRRDDPTVDKHSQRLYSEYKTGQEQR